MAVPTVRILDLIAMLSISRGSVLDYFHRHGTFTGHPTLARSLHTTLGNHKGSVHVVRYAKGTSKYVLPGGQDRTARL